MLTPIHTAGQSGNRIGTTFRSLRSSIEFHPEAFRALSADEQDVLSRYYALDIEVTDVYAYKADLDRETPDLASRALDARRALEKQFGR